VRNVDASEETVLVTL